MAVPAASATPAEPAPTSTSTSTSDQLALRLFARVGNFRKAPPERALFRELIDLAIGTTAIFEAGGYPVSAAHVWATGAALYFRSNAAGIIDDFSIKTLAADARLGERAVRAALSLYRRWKVIRSTRPRGRRKPAEHRINLGGLDWPAVRKRAALERAEQSQRPLDFDAESGHHDRSQRPESGHGDRSQGLRTEGRRDHTHASASHHATGPGFEQAAMASRFGVDARAYRTRADLFDAIAAARAAQEPPTPPARTERRERRQPNAGERRRQAEAKRWPSSGRIRNCPACPASDRGPHDCCCEACGWHEPGCPHVTEEGPAT